MRTARKGTRLSASDVPKGLVWIDGVRRSRTGIWEFEALCVNHRRIERASLPLETALVAPLVDVHAGHFQVSKTEMRFISIPFLERAEMLADPNDVLRLIAPGIRASTRHELYRVSCDPPIYVPALLLIRMLFTGNKLLDRLLFTENGVDLLGSARIDEGIVEVVAGPAYSNPSNKPVIPQMIAWTQLCPDARRSYGSVLNRFKQGGIGLYLPRAAYDCWAWGIATDVGLLVTEMNAVDLKRPIPADSITVRAGELRRQFRSYSPVQKSPLSSRRQNS